MAILIVAAATLRDSGFAKGRMRAVLDQPVPRDAKEGTRVTVVWRLQVERDGKYAPFSAGEAYVRLIGSAGLPSEQVVDGSGDGKYSASVLVPAGGPERVEVGIRGYAGPGLDAPRSDYPIAIVGPELTTPATLTSESRSNLAAGALFLTAAFGGLLLGFGRWHRRGEGPMPSAP